jgi:hypothetical protein
VSQEEVRFLPYEEAVKLVAAIQEEEDIEKPNRRILTIYNHADKEICWFDFDEVMTEVGMVKGEAQKERVSEYILNHIPDWALDI